MGTRPQNKREEDRVVDLLRQVPILHDLEKRSLEALLRDAREETYAPGQVMVKDGSLLAELYIILRGRVEVRKKSRVIAALGKGQFFGEMAFLDEYQTGRSADIVPIEQTTCLSIKGPAFYAFLRKNPDVAIEVIRTLAKRLRNANWALQELRNLPPAREAPR